MATTKSKKTPEVKIVKRIASKSFLLAYKKSEIG